MSEISKEEILKSMNIDINTGNARTPQRPVVEGGDITKEKDVDGEEAQAVRPQIADDMSVFMAKRGGRDVVQKPRVQSFDEEDVKAEADAFMAKRGGRDVVNKGVADRDGSQEFDSDDDDNLIDRAKQRSDRSSEDERATKEKIKKLHEALGIQDTDSVRPGLSAEERKDSSAKQVTDKKEKTEEEEGSAATKLLLLVEKKRLESTMTDPAIREPLLAYMDSKGSHLRKKFDLMPMSPECVAAFFRWTLEEQGKLPENDAARVGVKLVDILKKQGDNRYNQIAYFDAATNTFQWS